MTPESINGEGLSLKEAVALIRSIESELRGNIVDISSEVNELKVLNEKRLGEYALVSQALVTANEGISELKVTMDKSSQNNLTVIAIIVSVVLGLGSMGVAIWAVLAVMPKQGIIS